MKLAIVTDNSAHLSEEVLQNADVYVLKIPVAIDGKSYIEGENLTVSEFYQKMSQSDDLPKTSQPSIAELDQLLKELSQKSYSHVLGLFLSSGISGFWQNIQFLPDEYPEMTVVFPDTKITSAPLGMMVGQVLSQSKAGLSFDDIMAKLEPLIEKTHAFIMVDDLNHLVKGGRLSNGSALLGNLLKIKPILYFNDGSIEVYEKVRTEKKAIKRLIEILDEKTADNNYQVVIIHANCPEKAENFKTLLVENGLSTDIDIAPFGAVIGTHLGEGAIAFGISPKVA
ncbi:DegV family protein [Streptococcus moroccensis]|uniref:DegV family protein with EDD domain n=1 Tax=Streptococcus moroccensis TaxID=1451356 RepID=A0ABT9YUQ5_9STRE|nr:DegV family protein [Streptococcus moroccensis]MDQ0223515.1 DegV family protein with EDD domain [Streptococcus moroccensis]